MTPAGTSYELDVQNEWEENTQKTQKTRKSDVTVVLIVVLQIVFESKEENMLYSPREHYLGHGKLQDHDEDLGRKIFLWRKGIIHLWPGFFIMFCRGESLFGHLRSVQ